MIKYNLKQILEDKTFPPEPIIDNGILLDKTMLFIVGPAKSKKTFLTQNFALSIAMGNDFAGFKIPKPKKVLYLLAEGGFYPNRDRIQTMSENISITKQENFDIVFSPRININSNEGFESIIKQN